LDHRGTSGDKNVTEAEWLACTDPQKMLEFLRDKANLLLLTHFVTGWHHQEASIATNQMATTSSVSQTDHGDDSPDFSPSFRHESHTIRMSRA
jgi:hypothetical protein